MCLPGGVVRVELDCLIFGARRLASDDGTQGLSVVGARQVALQVAEAFLPSLYVGVLQVQVPLEEAQVQALERV